MTFNDLTQIFNVEVCISTASCPLQDKRKSINSRLLQDRMVPICRFGMVICNLVDCGSLKELKYRNRFFGSYIQDNYTI